ncbi:MAG: protein phosphatase CheZ [Candidatus Glassbacteria bacterium]|nr:protein phosphatase CheZ [Candidatus Glassbacteria bacterium]
MTKQELNRSSDELLGQASQQLGKVTESTRKVADQVMDRVDKICESQSKVFQRLGEMKELLKNLDPDPTARTVAESAEKIEEIENEIQAEAFEIMNEMQFQDITTQQIHQANNLIEEAERKLMDFGQILALVSGKKPKAKQSRAGTGVFDPGATLDKREERQSLADEITTRYEKKK